MFCLFVLTVADGEQLTTPAPLDTALPPYSRSLPNRSNATQRSMRSTTHQSMRKSRQRSSTRSTKSHRAARRARSAGRANEANHPNASHSSAHPTNELYGTYGKRRPTTSSINRNSTSEHHIAYGSNSHLQACQTAADTSSLDSYAGRSNHAYHESRTSLYKEDATSASIYESNQYRANGSHANTANTMNPSTSTHMPHIGSVAQQPLGSLSALATNGRHEAIYNIYSSNPYNTYGRSLGRPQQRPSSFCSNASSSSNNNLASTYGVNTNPSGGSTFHNPNRPASRTSPIYMNSETRI